MDDKEFLMNCFELNRDMDELLNRHGKLFKRHVLAILSTKICEICAAAPFPKEMLDTVFGIAKQTLEIMEDSK